MFSRRPRKDRRSPAEQMEALRRKDTRGTAVVDFRRAILKFITICFTAVSLGVIAVLMLVWWELAKVPNFSFLTDYKPASQIQVFDANDKLICTIEGQQKRHLVPLSRISPHLQRAVVTAEDRHFYEHHGVDGLGIARAVIANVTAGHTVQGGSTITQQLAKNLFYEDQKRNVILKVAETLVANQLETKFSKEKIMELYLNEVYFGNGAYGIEDAARRYFGKNANDLTIAESCFLAGVIRSPGRAGLPEYRREYMLRGAEILNSMAELGYITREQWAAARHQTFVFKSAPDPVPVARKISRYPYYVSTVIEQARQYYSDGEIDRQGLRIYTNLDPAAQEAAERAVIGGMRHSPRGLNQMALVSINVKDGAVVAMVGGVGDYMRNQWNCATNPHTAGSAFKPFVYLAALAQGMISPQSAVDDTPFEVVQKNGTIYKPKNYDGQYMGEITIEKALAQSRNICALRVAQKAGIDAIIETAKRAGIRQKLDRELALALGCSAVSPLDMCTAYATFARGGVYIPPYMIRRLESKTGKVLKVFDPPHNRVFDSSHIAQLVDMLQLVVTQGTGTQARLGNRPVAGKTGTADQAKDLWFVGFTPDLVTAVWGGNRDNLPIAGGHVTGGTVMARVWRDYNQMYYTKHEVPVSWFIACTKLVDFNPGKRKN